MPPKRTCVDCLRNQTTGILLKRIGRRTLCAGCEQIRSIKNWKLALTIQVTARGYQKPASRPKDPGLYFYLMPKDAAASWILVEIFNDTQGHPWIDLLDGKTAILMEIAEDTDWRGPVIPN